MFYAHHLDAEVATNPTSMMSWYLNSKMWTQHAEVATNATLTMSCKMLHIILKCSSIQDLHINIQPSIL